MGSPEMEWVGWVLVGVSMLLCIPAYYGIFCGLRVKIDKEETDLTDLDVLLRSVMKEYQPPTQHRLVKLLFPFARQGYRSMVIQRILPPLRIHVPLSILEIWGALLPTRVGQEDLGDYLDDIHQRIASGQRWCVYLRVIAAIFWTGLNAVGYAMKVLGKRKAS